MSDFVESLKRLYANKLLSIEQLNQLYSQQKIGEWEFKYITKKEA
jgi:hypothetical protein